MCTPVPVMRKSVQEISWKIDLLHELRLDRLRFGAVGGASTLALAGVFAVVVFVASALALAVVLAFAGVLGYIRFVLGYHDAQESSGTCRCCRLARGRLGVKASGGTAEEAGESRGQSDVAYC